MKTRRRKIVIVFEIIQWFLLCFILFACLFICPRVMQHVKEEERNHLYQQIHNDQRIERLSRENLILLDSIIILNEEKNK